MKGRHESNESRARAAVRPISGAPQMSLQKAAKAKADKKVLYVGGLEEEVTEKLVHAAFVPFGAIQQIDIPLDQATQAHRGFCFVTFNTEEDAGEALFNMNNSELLGRVLKVNVAKPMSIKQGSNKPVWAEADKWADQLQVPNITATVPWGYITTTCCLTALRFLPAQESSTAVDEKAVLASKPVETTRASRQHHLLLLCCSRKQHLRGNRSACLNLHRAAPQCPRGTAAINTLLLGQRTFSLTAKRSAKRSRETSKPELILAHRQKNIAAVQVRAHCSHTTHPVAARCWLASRWPLLTLYRR